MTARLALTLEAFFGAGGPTPDFIGLTRKCTINHSALSVEIGADAVSVTLVPGQTPPGPIRLKGLWRIAELTRLPTDQTGVRLMLPLLCRLSAIVLPHDQIHAISREHRSPAAFLARNLVFALTRSAPLTLTPGAADVAAQRGPREFQNHYLFALKAQVAEAAFEGLSASEILDLVLSNCYLPVLSCSNPLFERSSERIRQMQRSDVSRLKPQLIEARTAMLTQLQQG